MSTHSTAQSDPEFRRVSMGEIETPYGLHLEFTNVKTSDGVVSVLFYLAEGGKDEAALAFEDEVTRAAKIVQRTTKQE